MMSDRFGQNSERLNIDMFDRVLNTPLGLKSNIMLEQLHLIEILLHCQPRISSKIVRTLSSIFIFIHFLL